MSYLIVGVIPKCYTLGMGQGKRCGVRPFWIWIYLFLCFQFSTFSPRYIWFPHIWSLSILNIIKFSFPVEMRMGYFLGYTWKTKRLEKAWGVASNCPVQMCNLGDWCCQIPNFPGSCGESQFDFHFYPLCWHKGFISLAPLTHLSLVCLLSLKYLIYIYKQLISLFYPYLYGLLLFQYFTIA